MEVVRALLASRRKSRDVGSVEIFELDANPWTAGLQYVSEMIIGAWNRIYLNGRKTRLTPFRCPMYLTWARNLALFLANETIHGIPMCSATPAPVNDCEPSVIARTGMGFGEVERWGGSKAEAG